MFLPGWRWITRLMNQAAAQGRGDARQPRGRRNPHRLRLEELESRLAPANYTWSSAAGTLLIDLGTNESLAIVGGPGTRTFSLTGGAATFTQLGGNTAGANGTAALSFASTDNIGTSLTVTNAIAGAGT